MKNLLLLSGFALFATVANAQTPTSLSENFDTCKTSSATNIIPPPTAWSVVSVKGTPKWTCYSQFGNTNSPCVEINGYQGGQNIETECWLVSPEVDLTSYTADIYLNFFSVSLFEGDSLHVMATTNYTGVGTSTWTEIHPIFGNFLTDTGQGTIFPMQSDLSGVKSATTRVAFKYTATTLDGRRQNLDDVSTTTVKMDATNAPTNGPSGIANVQKQNLPLTVIGNATSANITFQYSVNQAGAYNVTVYDMVGRQVAVQQIQAGKTNVAQKYTISGLNLLPGMYILKVANGSAAGITKVSVQ